MTVTIHMPRGKVENREKYYFSKKIHGMCSFMCPCGMWWRVYLALLSLGNSIPVTGHPLWHVLPLYMSIGPSVFGRISSFISSPPWIHTSDHSFHFLLNPTFFHSFPSPTLPL